MAKTVVGFFDAYDSARGAYDELVRQGIDRNQISLITNRETYRGSDVIAEAHGGAPTGAAVGAATGAVVGGSVALVASLIPGVGPVLALGPVLATLFGASAGAVAGGIIGALVDIGVPEEDARMYEEGVRRGGTLLILHAPNNKAAKRAADIMNKLGAQDIKRRSPQWQPESQQKYAGPPTSPAVAASGISPPHPGEERREDRQRAQETRIPIGGQDSDDQEVPIVAVVEEVVIVEEESANRDASRIENPPASQAPRREDQRAR